MSHSTLRKSFRVRTLSAPVSVASQVAARKQESARSEINAKKKIILEAASRAPDLPFPLIDDISDIKACAEVGQELSNMSDIVEKELHHYKEECLTNWVNDLIAELIAPYERYHIHQWIQEGGGCIGVLKLVRNKYQAFVDCVSRSRRLGSWRQIAVVAGAVTIGVIAVGAGIWYFR